MKNAKALFLPFTLNIGSNTVYNGFFISGNTDLNKCVSPDQNVLSQIHVAIGDKVGATLL